MIIVSDTSIITNLFQLQQLKLLNLLFDEVILPTKVHEELSQLKDQAKLIDQFDWVKVIAIENIELFDKLSDQLDPGEAESIVLALEKKADLILIDEKKGRKIAKDYGLNVTGLIGILIEAKNRNHINLVKPILDKLIYEIGFRIHPKLYNKIIELVNE